MKDLREALVTKKSIKNIVIINNRFGITKKDLIGDISVFPLGVVVKMLEEQEKQGNKPDVKVFQTNKLADNEHGGFYWDNTEDGDDFWYSIIEEDNFNIFYKKYPEYRKYDR